MNRVVDEMTDDELFEYMEERYPCFFFVGKPREHDKEEREMTFRCHGKETDRWGVLAYSRKCIEHLTDFMFHGNTDFSGDFEGGEFDD